MNYKSMEWEDGHWISIMIFNVTHLCILIHIESDHSETLFYQVRVCEKETFQEAHSDMCDSNKSK